MATKLVSLSGQFALAWLLMPTDMGLAALALSVANIVSLVGPASLNTILIQRESEFDALAPKVFWLAVFLGSVAGLVVLGSAPIAARVLNEPRVAPLIAILALNLPISAFPVLYSGELYRGLRFRTVSLVHLSSAVVQWGSAVATAAAGFGAYALVVPIVLAGAFAAAHSGWW